MEYSIIGAAVNLMAYYQTHLTFRAACGHRLDWYLQTVGRKPPYHGYSNRENARAAWCYYLQTGVIQMASHMPPSQPMTPQRNCQMNLQSPAHLHPSLHSPPNLPTMSQHGANHALSQSLPLPPQYFAFPPLLQPCVLITHQDPDTSYFVVTVGNGLGVYATQ